jgi:hypothetical protein
MGGSSDTFHGNNSDKLEYLSKLLGGGMEILKSYIPRKKLRQKRLFA